MQTWALIVDAFREARDKRLFWILLAVSTVVGLALACVGFDDEGWSLFFGAVRMPFPKDVAGAIDPAQLLAAVVSYVLVDNYIAWLGTLACLIATAGFIPSFLAQGSVEVVLGKPISRVRVFLGKYVGALSFVLVQSAYFVLLTLIVLRLQSGRWFWGYLWAIPLLVALFSYLYCVCALFGVLTRSTLAALILTLLFWVTVAGAAAGDALLSSLDSEHVAKGAELTWHDRSTAGKALHAMRLVLPKTSDTPVLVARGMNAASMSDLASMFASSIASEDETQAQARTEVTVSAEELEQNVFSKINVVDSVGTSLMFEVVILGLACWVFWRQDY